jgi:hypothetical protein
VKSLRSARKRSGRDPSRGRSDPLTARLRCFCEPVAECDRFSASISARESLNIKSSGNRSALRLTCSFNRLVVTPYRVASSASSKTQRLLNTTMARLTSSAAESKSAVDDFRLTPGHWSHGRGGFKTRTPLRRAPRPGGTSIRARGSGRGGHSDPSGRRARCRR